MWILFRIHADSSIAHCMVTGFNGANTVPANAYFLVGTWVSLYRVYPNYIENIQTDLSYRISISDVVKSLGQIHYIALQKACSHL